MLGRHLSPEQLSSLDLVSFAMLPPTARGEAFWSVVLDEMPEHMLSAKVANALDQAFTLQHCSTDMLAS